MGICSCTNNWDLSFDLLSESRRSLIDVHVLCFYPKTGFWPLYCQISTDLDKILHTPIVIHNTLVGRLRPRSARGRLQAKPERLYVFVILVTHSK